VSEQPALDGTPSPRTRTITWEDHGRTATRAATMTGVEVLRAIVDRALPPPPVLTLIGSDLPSELEEGRVVLSLVPDDFHYNSLGIVSGGVAASLLDTAMGMALHSTLAKGASYSTLQLKVSYTRIITSTCGRVLCSGEVVCIEEEIATMRGELRDERGKLYAYGTSMCRVKP
jgi:uncharacterized protein (TIGR00369 family)